jgi:hypothetical protein
LTDWDGNRIEGSLVDGTFPDYQRVIPRGEPPNGTVTLAREPFLKAVAAATAFAELSEGRAALRFSFAPDKLTVSAAVEEHGAGCRGSAALTVDITGSTMTEPRDVGFSGPYALDIIKSLVGRPSVSTFSTWVARMRLPATKPTTAHCMSSCPCGYSALQGDLPVSARRPSLRAMQLIGTRWAAGSCSE